MIDFEEVYRDYLEDVYRFSLALCRDPVLAEELTQETFFRALEHIGQFRGECTLRVWLCQIAKHAWLTHCRRQRRREPEPELREEGPEERLAQKETAISPPGTPQPARALSGGLCPAGAGGAVLPGDRSTVP